MRNTKYEKCTIENYAKINITKEIRIKAK